MPRLLSFGKGAVLVAAASSRSCDAKARTAKPAARQHGAPPYSKRTRTSARNGTRAALKRRRLPCDEVSERDPIKHVGQIQTSAGCAPLRRAGSPRSAPARAHTYAGVQDALVAGCAVAREPAPMG